jgi:hypothetical protein
MFVHGYFRLKWGLCGHLSSTRSSYTSPHICFLAIDHILGHLVETISWFKNPYVLAFGIIENGHSWLFSTKMEVVWPLIIDQRLVHLTPHMFPCDRSHSLISGGDHFLVKNPNVLAFGTIENGRSWLFSTKMGVVWPLIFDKRLIHLTTHMFRSYRSHSWIYGGDHFLVKNP